MLGVYTVGVIFSVLLMIAGACGGMYFCLLYHKRDMSSRSATALFWAVSVGLAAIVLATILWESEIIRWIVVGAALLLIAITIIICAVTDIRNGLLSDAKINIWTHVLFVLAIVAIPVGRLGGNYFEQAQMKHNYTKGSRKVIERVYKIASWETIYEWVDGNYGSEMIPVRKDSVRYVYLQMSDGSMIFIGKENPNRNYNMLYPIGDTITVYKGRPVKLR